MNKIDRAAEVAPHVLPTYLGELVADMLWARDVNNPEMLADEVLSMPPFKDISEDEDAEQDDLDVEKA